MPLAFHLRSRALTGMLPNFLVIGATKCGTSSLWGMLKRHPQVFMCDPKEPQFFSRPDCFNRGVHWYESLFAGAGNAVAVGDGSANYANAFFAEAASQRISELLPHARLVYCVRHPLRRFESAWIHVRSREYTQRDLACGIRPIPRDVAKALRKTAVGKDVLETSMYWRQLQRFRRFFPDERIHIWFFEDFLRNPQSTLARCFEFLGVRPAPAATSPMLHLNNSSGKREPTRLLESLSLVPVLSRLTRWLPDSWTRQPAKKPKWDAQTYSSVCRVLQEDARLFLHHFGRPASFWDFGPDMRTPETAVLDGRQTSPGKLCPTAN